MKRLCVIPARYQSSRFPGKPIVDILGKPMIVRVYERASQCPLFDEVIVATEDERIVSVCDEYGVKTIMTSTSHKTGTDRLSEVAQKKDADIYINIQGDEPLMPLGGIPAVIAVVENGECEVSNGMSEIVDEEEINSPTVPKVLFTENELLIYMSRSAVPFYKSNIKPVYHKQVCVYAFTKDALLKFGQLPRRRLEQREDIEILRYIEHGYKVKMVSVPSGSIAVDVPEDVKKVCDAIQNDSN